MSAIKEMGKEDWAQRGAKTLSRRLAGRLGDHEGSCG